MNYHKVSLKLRYLFNTLQLFLDVSNNVFFKHFLSMHGHLNISYLSFNEMSSISCMRDSSLINFEYVYRFLIFCLSRSM